MFHLRVPKCLFIQQPVLPQQLAAPFHQTMPGLGVVRQGLPEVLLGQTEEVGVAQRADVGRAAIPGDVAGDLEDAYLRDTREGEPVSSLVESLFPVQRVTFGRGINIFITGNEKNYYGNNQCPDQRYRCR